MADEQDPVKKWAKKLFSTWPPPVPSIEDRVRAGESLGQAVLGNVCDTFGAVAARARKYSGDDVNSRRYGIYGAVLPVAEVAAKNEAEIAALKKQVAELQAVLKPPAA